MHIWVFLIQSASLIHLVCRGACLATTAALSQSMTWFCSTAWLVMADLRVTLLSLAQEAWVCVPAVKESTSFRCSFILNPKSTILKARLICTHPVWIAYAREDKSQVISLTEKAREREYKQVSWRQQQKLEKLIERKRQLSTENGTIDLSGEWLKKRVVKISKHKVTRDETADGHRNVVIR